MAQEFRDIPNEPLPGDEMLKEFPEKKTPKLTQRTANLLGNIDDWSRQKADLRRQLFEMLGLQPALMTSNVRFAGFALMQKKQFRSLSHSRLRQRCRSSPRLDAGAGRT